MGTHTRRLVGDVMADLEIAHHRKPVDPEEIARLRADLVKSRKYYKPRPGGPALRPGRGRV